MADAALYGHPFRAIWQQLAGDLGITTGRMRDIQIDQASQQSQALRDSNMAIAEAMQGADPEQAAQLTQQMRDMALLAQGNINRINTGQQPLILPDASQIVAPFYAAREQQRQGIEATNAQHLYDQLNAAKTDYQKQIDLVDTGIDKAHTAANTLLQMASAKGLGADDPAVQSRFKETVGANAADFNPDELKASGPFGEILASIFSNQAKKTYTAEEINKGTLAWLNGQTQGLAERKAAILKAAQAQGFVLSNDGITHPLLTLNRPEVAQGALPQAGQGGPAPPTPPPGSTPITVPHGASGSFTPEQKGAGVGATVGSVAGHMAAHALLGARLGRMAGPTGMIVGGAIGAVAGEGLARMANDTLDKRVVDVAGPNVFEQNGVVVNEQGQPVPIPRGLADQVARRARQRLREQQRSVNP